MPGSSQVAVEQGVEHALRAAAGAVKPGEISECTFGHPYFFAGVDECVYHGCQHEQADDNPTAMTIPDAALSPSHKRLPIGGLDAHGA